MPATAYDPSHDSSPETDHLRIPNGDDDPALEGLILLQGTHQPTGLPLCYCGCVQPTNGKARMFKQGHDQRLLGKLVRAHLAGVEVHLRSEGDMTSTSATQVAKNLDAATGGHHWSDRLRRATSRATETSAARAQRFAERAAAPAPQPEPADRLQAAKNAAVNVRAAIADRREQIEAVDPAPVVERVAGTVKVGRWDYPAYRDSHGAVERNTARDGSGKWVPAEPKAQASFTATK